MSKITDLEYLGRIISIVSSKDIKPPEPVIEKCFCCDAGPKYNVSGRLVCGRHIGHILDMEILRSGTVLVKLAERTIDVNYR